MFSAQKNAAPASGKLFVEDVFSTYLYTGNGGTQTITNGIDLAGKGGLVWLKMRSPGSGWSSTQSHALFDTVRGDDKYLSSDLTNGQYTFPNNGITFNSSGFGIDAASYFGGSGDQSTSNFASWTFREAPKFFDVVTFTVAVGGTTTFNHSLGSIPGCVIIKSTSSSDDWSVVHRGANGISRLNTTAANTGTSFPGIGTSGAWMNCTATTFNVSNFVSEGQTYVAYLFAHDETADGVIQCGSFTTNGSGNATVNLGWEPQWLTGKCSSLGGPWVMVDTMRGMTANGADVYLLANTSGAEATTTIYAPEYPE